MNNQINYSPVRFVTKKREIHWPPKLECDNPWIPKFIVRFISYWLNELGFSFSVPITENDFEHTSIEINYDKIEEYFHQMIVQCYKYGKEPGGLIIGWDVAPYFWKWRSTQMMFRPFVLDIHNYAREEFCGIPIHYVPWSTGATVIPKLNE